MNPNRIVYIDTIKVFLTCLVVAHHAAQAYGPTGGIWVVNNLSKTNWLGQFFFINASFMMGLYFFISGYFMVFSLARKTTAQFIKDRLVRLGVPLLLFTFFIFLPFNYSGAVEGTNISSFFIDTYFNKPPIATGHLWFVASLLVYSIIYVVFLGKINLKTKNAVQKSFKTYYIIIYIILLTIVSAIVRLKYPIDEWHTWLIPVEVAHVPQYLSLFLIGTLFNHYKWLDTFTVSTGICFLLVAIVAYVLNETALTSLKNNWLTESFIESLLCVGISVALLTFFRLYGNRTTAFLQSLSNNAYGIYLFHLFIVIALQQFLLQWNVNANVKFMLVTIGGILFSFWISALLRKSSWIKKVL